MAVAQDRREARPLSRPGLRHARLQGIGRREWWGYGVWIFVGAVIAVSELWAVAGNPWWPTISATVGHLELLWSPVRVIVIALIVSGAVQVFSYPPRRREFRPPGARPLRWRTDDLDRRWHPAVPVILAGLAVLAIHLVAYPWP
jgi:hypothetical protein